MAPGQLAGHEAAWKGTLQDTDKRPEQALTESTVSCCISYPYNMTSGSKTEQPWHVLNLICLGQHNHRQVTHAIDGA